MDILGYLRDLGREPSNDQTIKRLNVCICERSNDQTIKRSNDRVASRRGSALLIVLGMLAFMIISAVAFAAYMRFSRLPSSYLRRTSASRQLVKAALSRAIDEIDASIGNNPHPGVGTEMTRYPRNTDQSKGQVGLKRQRNIWLHRVFFGTNVACSVEETVSPLTLEGLAYIPPPLVNEARYFSRRSPAASWKSLGFDAGRYVFCALDVSDYFDINRMTANVPRSSAGNRRVSLAYLFESSDHKSPGSDAKSWDDWMKNYRTINDDSELEWSGSVAPLVSLADFNLAFGHKGGIGKMISPFYKLIDDGNRNTFYAAKGDDDYDRINRMTFVTDGLFPAEDAQLAAADKSYDLSDPQYQPFRNIGSGKKPSISDLLMGSAHQNESDMAWHKRLGGVGLAALYDYLDPDHAPVSLAVPTTERTPMVCGVQTTLTGAKLAVKKGYEYTDDNGQNGNGDPKQVAKSGDTRKVEQIVHYRVDPTALNLLSGAVNALFVYPFNKSVEYSDKFKVDGRLSFFFSTEQMSLRTGNNNPNTEVLHIAEKGNASAGVDANGLMNIVLSGDLAFDTKNAPETEEKAVKDITMPFMAGGAAELGLRLQGESKLLSVKYTWTQTFKANEYVAGASGTWEPKFDDMIKNQGWEGEPVYSSDLCIVNGSGVRQDVKNLVPQAKPIYLNMAVWLRIKNKNDDVVDMVPACLGDDSIENPTGGGINAFDMLNGGEFGQYYPLMRFDTLDKGACASLTFSVEELEKLAAGTTQPQEIKLWPTTAFVADPRFNHAPENWFAYDGNLSKNNWIENNHVSDTGRDGDIFMDVSDNGYLQSKYELAMLPACGHLQNTGTPTGLGRMPQFTTYSGKSIPGSFNDTVQGGFMWKTYDPVDTFADEFYDIRWVGNKTGYRVCPYSDSTNVIMAALANTPLNWACAGTNDVDDAVNFNYSDPSNSKGIDFNKDYAWNSYSSGGRFAWSDLQSVAGNFIKKVREKNGNWEDAWDDLAWYDDDFCGVNLSSETDDLWTVDRKFFYGYWKECFAAKQQLFLVFVRAEPAMMGGGGMGQIPPQLGARAVALVWRNPSTTDRKGDALAEGTPHQTRVLFYRQLD